MAQGRNLKGMVFLEGRSVPFIGVQCSFEVGRPSTANIELPPLPEIADILPRTHVTVFVRDVSYPGASKPWVLMFDGEVFGYGFSKGALNRSFSISCMDISNYWDSAKQYYLNPIVSAQGGEAIANITQLIKENANQDIPTKVITTTIRSHISKSMVAALKTGKSIVSAILSLSTEIKKANSFFNYMTAKHRLDDRVVSYDSGNLSALYTFSDQEQWFDDIMGHGDSSVITFRQTLDMLLGIVFHESVSIALPSKVKYPGIKNGIGAHGAYTVGSVLFKPESYMLPPPKCNVVYPDQYNSFNFNRIFFHEITRLQFRVGLPAYLQANKISTAFLPRYYSPTRYSAYMGQFLPKDKPDLSDPVSFAAKASKLEVSATYQEFHYSSEEEKLKGIFAQETQLPQPVQAMARHTNVSKNSSFYQQYCDYEFSRRKYAARQTSVSGVLNLAPAVGFPIVFLDDSSAQQNLIATLSGLQHTLRADGGGFTTYHLTFGRHIEEKDFLGSRIEEPAIPPWFSSDIYGKRRALNASDYSYFQKLLNSVKEGDKGSKDHYTGIINRIKKYTEVNDFGNAKIGTFYSSLLGDSSADNNSLGAGPITSPAYPNIVCATLALVQEYRNAKAAGRTTAHIDSQTRRDYVTMSEFFSFVGAHPSSEQSNIDYTDSADVVFSGSVYDTGNVDGATGLPESTPDYKDFYRDTGPAAKRAVINKYRKRLLNERGFSG
jgi:hypothetical protein